MAKKRDRQFASQAALQALVRYGPELSGLKELRRQAEDNLNASLAQAHGGAQGIISTVDQVAPQVAGIYDNAGLAQAALNHTLIGNDLAGLGGVANSIKAGASLEAAGMASRLNEAKARSLLDLGQRRVQARQGEQFAVKNAQQQFVQDMTKILQRGQDLAPPTAAPTGPARPSGSAPQPAPTPPYADRSRARATPAPAAGSAPARAGSSGPAAGTTGATDPSPPGSAGRSDA